MQQIKTSQFFKIKIETSKTLVKFTNLKNEEITKVNLNNLKKAYDLKSDFLTSAKVIDLCFFLSDAKLSNLNKDVLSDSKRLSSIECIKNKGNDLKRSFGLDSYSFECLFKETINS